MPTQLVFGRTVTWLYFLTYLLIRKCILQQWSSCWPFGRDLKTYLFAGHPKRFSALEILRIVTLQIQIYLLTYLLTYSETGHTAGQYWNAVTTKDFGDNADSLYTFSSSSSSSSFSLMTSCQTQPITAAVNIKYEYNSIGLAVNEWTNENWNSFGICLTLSSSLSPTMIAVISDWHNYGLDVCALDKRSLHSRLISQLIVSLWNCSKRLI